MVAVAYEAKVAKNRQTLMDNYSIDTEPIYGKESVIDYD